MALQLHASGSLSPISICCLRYVKPRVLCIVKPNLSIRCVNGIHSQPEAIDKPSAVVYQPTIWNYDFVESLRSNYEDDIFKTRAKELAEDVRVLLNKETEPKAQFKQIDVLQRLGLEHLFHEEIHQILQSVYSDSNTDKFNIKDDLSAIALHFRLLRQHGYLVSEDVFSGFLDENGKFKESLRADITGILSLYESSSLSVEGESILDEARDFTRRYLEDIMGYKDSSVEAHQVVKHSLEVPLHWRMLRPETRWYIDAYQEEEDMNPKILELAKLDFNMVQALHQRNLRHASRWWRNIGLAARLSFARDRLVESFFWSLGLTCEPQYERCRNWLTKVMKFVMIIDDIYDVHGSIEELQLFTDAVERWDVEAMKELPSYMKIAFLALFNTTNEMAYDILCEQGWDILPYLQKTWADFIKAMFVEAKWYQTRTTPSTKDYLKNGWVSSSGTIFLVHAFFATGEEINEEILECLKSNPDLIFGPSMIFRLSNDLATSLAELERGDVSSSIHCYMHEHKVSEQIAREYIKEKIMETWKLMNKCITNSPFSRKFVQICLNLARTSLCVYQYGDGLGSESYKSKDHVLSLIVKPIEIGSTVTH